MGIDDNDDENITIKEEKSGSEKSNSKNSNWENKADELYEWRQDLTLDALGLTTPTLATYQAIVFELEVCRFKS